MINLPIAMLLGAIPIVGGAMLIVDDGVILGWDDPFPAKWAYLLIDNLFSSCGKVDVKHAQLNFNFKYLVLQVCKILPEAYFCICINTCIGIICTSYSLKIKLKIELTLEFLFKLKP